MKVEGNNWGWVPILLCLVAGLILEKVWNGDARTTVPFYIRAVQDGPEKYHREPYPQI